MKHVGMLAGTRTTRLSPGGEPKFCGEMRASGSWNDDRCNAQLAYVCECDGQPSAAAWCDTDDEQTCGDCSTSCGADQSCVSQLCK